MKHFFAGMLFVHAQMFLLSGCTAPEAVQTAHREAALDAKAVFEAYLIQLRAVVPADAEQAAQKERIISLVEMNSQRFFEKHGAVGSYLEAPPVFANDQERADFLALIRAARGVQ